MNSRSRTVNQCQPESILMSTYDLVTFGETMIRLTAPGHERLESTTSLDVTVGGTESNVAVALARLGRRVAWLSALPDNAFGRRVIFELRGHGVDTSHVVMQPEGRVGTYFLEPGAVPRPTRVVYDRVGSAVATLRADALDVSIVQRARVVHLTGITPALSSSCAEICLSLASEAADAGVQVVFDVNYRARLWSPAEAAEGVQALLHRASLLFCGREDATTIWGLTGDATQIAHGLLERSTAKMVVLTLGDQGAIALDRDGRSWRQPGSTVEIVDPIGAGDAFAGGFLSRWLDDREDVGAALRAGVALASLKMTMRGDLAVITPAELNAAVTLLDRPASEIER